jgi:putative RecB family exonuclease
MAPLPLPSSLSPSKVSSFTECGMAFKFSAIDRVPEPASPWTAKGTLVHLALERLHADVPAGRRTPDEAARLVREAVVDVLGAPECDGLDVGDLDLFTADAEQLARNVFLLEDPNAVRAVGLELKLEAQVGGLVLRGVIDRLDLCADGSLVVVDYKTGRAPAVRDEKARLAGVHFYAFLVEQTFGVLPARVELLHLREPMALSSVPGDRSRAELRRRTAAIWAAIEQACATDGFQPRPSSLCSVCGYRSRCPAWAGTTADEAVPVAL